MGICNDRIFGVEIFDIFDKGGSSISVNMARGVEIDRIVLRKHLTKYLDPKASISRGKEDPLLSMSLAKIMQV
jgi:hypothetical protein